MSNSATLFLYILIHCNGNSLYLYCPSWEGRHTNCEWAFKDIIPWPRNRQFQLNRNNRQWMLAYLLYGYLSCLQGLHSIGRGLLLYYLLSGCLAIPLVKIMSDSSRAYYFVLTLKWCRTRGRGGEEYTMFDNTAKIWKKKSAEYRLYSNLANGNDLFVSNIPDNAIHSFRNNFQLHID